MGIKRVNITDYYIDKIRLFDREISRLKGKGVSSNQGIAFVTFSNEDCVYETFTDFDLIIDIAKNSEASKLLKIHNWSISYAPPPSDIIWENLSHLTKFRRKLLRIFYLIVVFVISIILIAVLAFLDKYSPLMHRLYNQRTGSTMYQVVPLQYMTPTVLLLYNYVIVPLFVKKFVEKSLYIRKSHKERSNLSGNYIFLVSNSIFLPIASFGVVYYYQLLPTGAFFLRYLVQTCFIYSIIHITGLPKYLDKYFNKTRSDEKNFSSSSVKIIDPDMLDEHEQTPVAEFGKNSRLERSNKWYFEIGYQQSFSIAVFTLTFVFA